jgi:hypothetical protein
MRMISVKTEHAYVIQNLNAYNQWKIRFILIESQ